MSGGWGGAIEEVLKVNGCRWPTGQWTVLPALEKH